MSFSRIYTGQLPARRGSLKAALLSIASTVVMWRRRARDRSHLRDLEPYLLDDVGIPPERRDREVRKPFWVR